MTKKLCLCFVLFLLAALPFAAVQAEALPVKATTNMTAPQEPLTPAQYRRPPDQTFLTFPEWFLVFSPAEYATFLKNNPPSDFPFFGHIRQFWQGYSRVYGEIKGKYPFNTGYHVMIMVIGVSTTVEYTLKAAYETLFGRLSALTRTHGMTAEDELAASEAQDYVDFIRTTPWYEYDFATWLKKLWTQTGYGGHDLIRKWERKFALTNELAVKAGYGWLIKKGTKAAYDAPSLETVVVLDHLPEGMEKDWPKIRLIERLANGDVLVALPRYDEFKDYAAALARHGASFIEVAGNRADIAVSVIAPENWTPDAKLYRVLFTQKILTQPGKKRVFFATPIAQLSDALKLFDKDEFTLEHVYDF